MIDIGTQTESDIFGFDQKQLYINFEDTEFETVCWRQSRFAEEATVTWKIESDIDQHDIQIFSRDSGELTFNKGSMSEKLYLSLRTNAHIEDEKVFNLTLVSVSSSISERCMKIIVKPPLAVKKGYGFVEFVKKEYFVEESRNRVKVRLRRRGSIGRVKTAEIYTRDREAEEGRHYFCEGNQLGILKFGPDEYYKDISFMIGKRSLTQRFRNKQFKNYNRFKFSPEFD